MIMYGSVIVRLYVKKFIYNVIFIRLYILCCFFIYKKFFFIFVKKCFVFLVIFFLYKLNMINNCKIIVKKNVMLFNRKNDLIEKKLYIILLIIGFKIFDKEVVVWFKVFVFWICFLFIKFGIDEVNVIE